MVLPDSSILTNIHFAGNENPGNSLFEKKYITIRCMENRLYSDTEVMNLPDISPEHTHASEWVIRKRSCLRLIHHLTEKENRLQILEPGCGNGWLSHCLAGIPEAEVTGLDINFTELQQAARVFNENERLRFIYGDLESGALNGRKFDCIVFAAAIQYFCSLRETIGFCLKLLKSGGEIHLLDSPFYEEEEIEAAKERTFLYYDSLGYPEMCDYYFHHHINDLKGFRYHILQNPNSLFNKFWGNRDCFHWICIKK